MLQEPPPAVTATGSPGGETTRNPVGRAAPEDKSAPSEPGREPTFTSPYPAQQGVIEQYGWPQTFRLMFYGGETGDAVVRHETWNYHAAGVAFSFINGRQGGRPAPLADIPGAVYPDYRPTRFTAGMTVTQAFNALPAVTEYYQEQMPGKIASTYWVDHLVMGFVDDVLVYVETRPQLPAASEVKR